MDGEDLSHFMKEKWRLKHHMFLEGYAETSVPQELKYSAQHMIKWVLFHYIFIELKFMII